MTNKSVPFGYQKNEDGEITEAADEQEIISMIRELREQGYSLSAIKKCLEKEGVLPFEEWQKDDTKNAVTAAGFVLRGREA